MSTSDISAGETFLSVNGFDNIAIRQQFGSDVYTLREQPLEFLRVMTFIHMRRNGVNDVEARSSAMNLTVGDLTDYFAAEQTEVDPDDPETDEGKDSTA